MANFIFKIGKQSFSIQLIKMTGFKSVSPSAGEQIFTIKSNKQNAEQ